MTDTEYTGSYAR